MSHVTKGSCLSRMESTDSDSLCPKCRQSFADSRGVLVHLNNKYSSCCGFLDDYDALSTFTEEDMQRRAQSAFNAFRDRVPPLRSPRSPPPPPSPPISEISPHTDAPSTVVEYHPRSSFIYGQGANTFERILGDSFAAFAHRREVNPYYPFQGREEWELARFLARSSLSQTEIDDFLKLKWVMRFITFVESSLQIRCR